MKIQEATKRETLHIAEGTLAFSAVMNAVFALAGKWELPVLWGTLLGGGFAVLNFLWLGISIQKLTAEPDEKRARAKLQSSYTLRMVAMLAVGAIGVSLPCFSGIATVIPFLFPRLTIFAMQLLGVYRPEKRRDIPEGGQNEPSGES